jgi:hypothetical protein
LSSNISFPRADQVKREMRRLFSSLAPNPQSPASSGTEGDSLFLIVITGAFVVVGVYTFRERGGRVRM